jgi:hypothetical protein
MTDEDEYEQVRADNMARNNAVLTSLGFEPMAIAPPQKNEETQWR